MTYHFFLTMRCYPVYCTSALFVEGRKHSLPSAAKDLARANPQCNVVDCTAAGFPQSAWEIVRSLVIGYIDETGDREVGGTLGQSEHGEDGGEFKEGDENFDNLSQRGSPLRNKARWLRERSVSIGGLLVRSLWPAHAAQKYHRRFPRVQMF